MPKTSESELSRLLDDEELGKEAYRLNVLSRWPSLRVLDFLYTEGKSTAGEIARGVNMDMREIRETVETLSDIGILKEIKENGTSYWAPTSHKIQISFEDRDGLQLESKTELPESTSHKNSSSGSESGFFANMGSKLDGLVETFR